MKLKFQHLIGYWLLIPVAMLQAGTDRPIDEPPVAGQPLNFDGAIGSYKITTDAQPRALQAEDSLLFTVRIIGAGPAAGQPRRPNLRHLPEFKKHFHIEDLSARDHRPDEKTWEFHYRLQPLRPEVKEIPRLRFDYYKPGIIPAEKGYQAAYAPPIPLSVRPRATVQASDAQGAREPPPVPARFYHLEDVSSVLRQDKPFALPGPLLFGVILLVPPAGCALWYVVWKRRYPDEARKVKQRQSRAARAALHALHSWEKKDAGDQAFGVAAVVADYLRERLELLGAEPTPAEVAAHLQHHGCSGPTADQIALFLKRCDALRFGPPAAGDKTDMTAPARQLILALEEQSWPAVLS